MFDQYSERARRVIFLARELASTNGTTSSIEPSHLLDALVREDQGEFATRMPDVVAIAGKPGLRPSHPFFPAETAAAVLVNMRRIMPPKSEPIPLSTDVPVSPALQEIFSAAKNQANELQQKQVEPLHLLAALLSHSSEESSQALKQVGISKEAVIAALRRQ